jgi:hypothetical protein
MRNTETGSGNARVPLAACCQCFSASTVSTGGQATRGTQRGGDVRCGFTLIEGMMASVVLAAVTLAVLAAFTAAAQNGEAADESMMAAELARQLLDEIAAKPVLDPNNVVQMLGPDAGENGRAQFDNVDDYHGYRDSTKKLYGLDNVAVMDLPYEYKRSVTVEFRRPPGTTTARASADFVVVTVKVQVKSGPNGEYTFQRLFANVPRGGQ